MLIAVIRTENAKPIIEGDDNDVAVSGQNSGVPKITGAPLKGFSVNVYHDGQSFAGGGSSGRTVRT